MIKELVHNGVVVPAPAGPHNLILCVRGHEMALSPDQEEMAMAWARKLGTPYVEDPVFARNFLADFSAALGTEPPLQLVEVDFAPAKAIVDRERADRERLTPEERKARAAERKAAREAVREQYGHATLDGERVDLGTYLVEPSSIFMGRGQHPLRGHWKAGPKQRDITLNLSPDAAMPEGDWAGRVWEPESLWIARWKDKLSGKTKYIWLADTAPVKQSKEEAKFDKATELHANLEAVRARIREAAQDPDPRRRMVATACYLIDELCLRVGDEKDPDEADTVGATTLRPEHVTLHPDGAAEFKFLGKDSVLWHKTIKADRLPEAMRRNLAELIRDARPSRNGRGSAAGDRPQLFHDIGSHDVNAFLREALNGLTAKVFRTHHATAAVHESLEASHITAAAPDFRKREAVMQSNLAAATLCNHYKKAPSSWAARREKVRERREQLTARLGQAREQARQAAKALAAVRAEVREKAAAARSEAAKARASASGAKRIEKAKARFATARAKQERAQEALDKFNSVSTMASKARTWNLGTSLKSYIDPRVYEHWGRRVGYDVLGCYYPKTLQSKFAWARDDSEEPEAVAGEAGSS